MFRAFSYFFSFKIPNFFNKSFNVDSYNGLNKLKRRITISQVLFRFSIADRHLKCFVELILQEKKICEINQSIWPKMPLKIRNWCRYKPKERRLIEEVTRPILETQKVPLLDTKCWRDRVGIDVEQKPVILFDLFIKKTYSDQRNTVLHHFYQMSHHCCHAFFLSLWRCSCNNFDWKLKIHR